MFVLVVDVVFRENGGGFLVMIIVIFNFFDDIVKRNGVRVMRIKVGDLIVVRVFF